MGLPLLTRRLQFAVTLFLCLGAMLTVFAFHQAAIPVESVDPSVILPLDGRTILVDPGHGGYDGGARARDSGVWEKHINLAVALETEKALKAQGAAVILTRREDTDLCGTAPAASAKKRQDMEARVAMASAADMVLSIHMNEYRDRRQNGPQVFYRKGCDAGRLLAGCMQEALIGALAPKKERAAMAGDYFILQLDVPSVLVECGFISNAAEEKLLLSSDYQARLGEAIAAGVIRYAELADWANGTALRETEGSAEPS